MHCSRLLAEVWVRIPSEATCFEVNQIHSGCWHIVSGYWYTDTVSRLVSRVKHHRARVVLGWVTVLVCQCQVIERGERKSLKMMDGRITFKFLYHFDLDLESYTHKLFLNSDRRSGLSFNESLPT